MAYSDIKDPSAHFQVKVWTAASGSAVNVVNDGNSDLQPDLIWAKERTSPGGYDYNHDIVDSSRGRAKSLHTNTQGAENTASQTNYDLTSFNTDGFSTGAPESTNSLGGANAADGKVAWQWKANGGTTTSVSASGTGNQCINACTYQANTTAGFSIITYTGRDDQLNNGHESKLTHGLGIAPTAFICKRRDGTSNWYYLGGNQSSTNNGWNNAHLILNQLAAVNGNSYTSNTKPDATYIYLGNQLVNTVDSWIGYAFAEIEGYSKFGKYSCDYTTTDGPFVYCGFKPAFVMIKSTAQSTNWIMIDHKRNPSNVANLKLGANRDAGDNGSDLGNTTQNNIDLLSNGFKVRTRNTDTNYNTGDVNIFMAFAENPFVANGIPTTAR